MLDFVKINVSTGINIWQGQPETAQGGFTVNDAGFVKGDVIPAGTPIHFDEQTRMALVGKVGVVTEAAAIDAVAYKVKKGGLLKVGSTVNAVDGTAKAVTTIDKTNANYDLVTVAATLGVAVAVGDAIYVDDAGFSDVSGLSYEERTIGANGIASISVVCEGVVYARRITPVPASVVAQLPQIRFSQSF